MSYYHDGNGRWHGANGRFVSNAEVSRSSGGGGGSSRSSSAYSTPSYSTSGYSSGGSGSSSSRSSTPSYPSPSYSAGSSFSSSTPSYKLDASGRWHGSNGQFVSASKVRSDAACSPASSLFDTPLGPMTSTPKSSLKTGTKSSTPKSTPKTTRVSDSPQTPTYKLDASGRWHGSNGRFVSPEVVSRSIGYHTGVAISDERRAPAAAPAPVPAPVPAFGPAYAIDPQVFQIPSVPSLPVGPQLAQVRAEAKAFIIPMLHGLFYCSKFRKAVFSIPSEVCDQRPLIIEIQRLFQKFEQGLSVNLADKLFNCVPHTWIEKRPFNPAFLLAKLIGAVYESSKTDSSILNQLRYVLEAQTNTKDIPELFLSMSDVNNTSSKQYDKVQSLLFPSLFHVQTDPKSSVAIPENLDLTHLMEGHTTVNNRNTAFSLYSVLKKESSEPVLYVQPRVGEWKQIKNGAVTAVTKETVMKPSNSVYLLGYSILKLLSRKSAEIGKTTCFGDVVVDSSGASWVFENSKNAFSSPPFIVHGKKWILRVDRPSVTLEYFPTKPNNEIFPFVYFCIFAHGSSQVINSIVRNACWSAEDNWMKTTFNLPSSTSEGVIHVSIKKSLCGPMTGLTHDLHNLRVNNIACDVTLKVGARRFAAHAALLSARSPMLAALLASSDEAVLELPNISEQAAEHFLLYAYSAQVPGVEDVDVAVDLYGAALELEVPELQEVTKATLKSSLTEENVMSVLSNLSVSPFKKDLQPVVLEFLLERGIKERVLKSEGWLDFKDEHIEDAIAILTGLALQTEQPQEQAPVKARPSKDLPGMVWRGTSAGASPDGPWHSPVFSATGAAAAGESWQLACTGSSLSLLRKTVAVSTGAAVEPLVPMPVTAHFVLLKPGEDVAWKTVEGTTETPTPIWNGCPLRGAAAGDFLVFARIAQTDGVQVQPDTMLLLRQKLLADIGAMLENPQLTDVVLVSPQAQSVRAHRCILAARSPYFVATFCSGMRESWQGEVKTMFPKDLIEHLLKFMYYGIIPGDHSDLGPLKEAADYYMMEELRDLCMKAIASKL